jgi:hypothetical protein
MRKRRLALIGSCLACLLPGLLSSDQGARQQVQVSKTEKVDFPPGGTVRLQNSTGELTIEGWDQHGVELTTTKSTKESYLPAERAKAAQDLDRVHVTAKRDGNELVIASEFPCHRAFPFIDSLSTVTNFSLDYRIRVPRSAKLIVKHEDGEVHIDDVTGNIEVKARQGLIALRLVGEMPLAIDAKSAFGSVNSDFAGDESRHPWPFGHQLVQSAAAAPQSLHLRIGYGDIVILKAHNPQTPPALSK